MIRKATAADKPALLRMAIAFGRASHYAEHFELDPAAAATLVDYALARGVVFVADAVCPDQGTVGCAKSHPHHSLMCDDGQIVGMLAVVATLHPMTGRPSAAEIAWWVEPEYRRGPSGVQLLEAAEAWAKEQGAERFEMMAPAGAPAVARFYRMRGYRELETIFSLPLTT